MAEGALLQVNGLSVGFRAKNKPLAEAVRSVSYDVHRGEILAIVGESGSGKSVSAMGMLGLLPQQRRNLRLSGVRR